MAAAVKDTSFTAALLRFYGMSGKIICRIQEA